MRSLKCTMEGHDDSVEDSSFIELPVIYTFDIKTGQEYRYEDGKQDYMPNLLSRATGWHWRLAPVSRIMSSVAPTIHFL